MNNCLRTNCLKNCRVAEICRASRLSSEGKVSKKRMIHFASNNGVIWLMSLKYTWTCKSNKKGYLSSDYYMSIKMRFLLEMKGYHTDMGGAICVLEAHRVITGKRKFAQTFMLQIRKEKSARHFWFFMSQKKIDRWDKLFVWMSVHDSLWNSQ